jgi:hypothetical protein
MSKRRDRRSRRSTDETIPARSEPWIKTKTGLWMIGIVSLALAVYTGWQLYPAFGFWKSLLWGGGAAVALWLVFGMSYLVNVNVRR